MYIYDEGKDRIVCGGKIKGDTFYRKVDYSKHFMRNENGFGEQDVILTQLKRKGIKYIDINMGSAHLVSSIKQWLQKPIRNYGHGEQRFLTVKEMNVNQTNKQLELEF